MNLQHHRVTHRLPWKKGLLSVAKAFF